jgi:hypothetical protein
MSVRRCRNCTGSIAKRRGTRCSACARYFSRHGTERPEGLIERHGLRHLERELAGRIDLTSPLWVCDSFSAWASCTLAQDRSPGPHFAGAFSRARGVDAGRPLRPITHSAP